VNLAARSVSRLATVGLGAVLLFLTGFAVWGALTTKQAAQRLERSTVLSEAFDEARSAAASEDFWVSEYARLLGPEKEYISARTVRENHREAAAFLVEALRRAARTGDRVERARVAEVLADHRAYLAAASRMFAAIDRQDARAALRIEFREVDPEFLQIEQEVDGASTRHREEVLVYLRALDRVEDRVFTGTILAFAFGLLVLAFFGVILHAHRRRVEDARQAELRALEQTLSERKRSEEALTRLAAMVEASDDAIIGTNLEARVTSWNAGAEKLFGYSADAMHGKSVRRIIPADRQHELAEVGRLLVRGEVVAHYESRGLRKDGTEVDVSLTVSPIRDANGVVTGTAVVARNITREKLEQAQREALLAKEKAARAEAEAAQRALAEQNERLLELDRLKDEFVSLVSHELRTPLTSIRGYLDLVLEGEAGELTPDLERFLSVVNRNADRLLHLVGDLLFLAQVDAGKLALEFGPVELDEVVRQCVEAARPVAEENEIELTVSVEPVPTLLGDGARIAQVLDNLVSNALKFTPGHGRVEVRLLSADDRAVLEVEDTGLGIPAGEQGQLFERFFRSSSASENAIPGTGLGLTIAKAIVERHDGRITVESVERVGTTVRVELPIRAADGAQRRRTEVAA
jgi:PAS domain S-box-containing protein